MIYNPTTPVEWEQLTPESLYYIDQTMDHIDFQPTKTAGLMGRAFRIGMSEPAMIGVGAYGRTRDKLYNINNNTMNYSLGKTF